MATDEVEADSRRHKHRRRHHTESHQRRHEAPDGSVSQPTAPPLADDPFEKPIDTAALREARLKSMNTPAVDRKKMKIEHQHSRPAKSPAVVRVKSSKSTSASIFGRKTSVTIRPKSTVSTSTKKTGKEDGYEYVYGNKNSSGVIRRDFQREIDQADRLMKKATDERRRTTSTAAEKPKVERRRTEPASTLRRSSTTATARPQLRKSTSTAKASDVRADDNAVDKTTKTESVVSAAKPSKRQSSVLGLFTKPLPPPEKQVSCLTCGSDDIPASKSAKLPCTHRMCHSCLKRIFKMSIKDPAHMPPRCCQEKHISLRHVESLFDDDFKKTWNRKFKEYNAKNRIYCPRKGCGEWIQPKHMRVEKGRKIGICPKCKYDVCTMCNQKAHRSRECPKDPAMKQLTEIAEQKGWRKCYNCSAMVELKEGCNHMTCRCLAEFCMCCGLKWKSCECPWFNYEAVDDLTGNPVRYQQELDRRREQMQRDEEIARQMAGLNMRGRNRNGAGQLPDFELGNAAPHHMNANFLQQAREALTANYQNAEIAARGLLGGWLTGRENALPGGIPGDLNEQTQNLQQGPLLNENPLARRRTYRLRHALNGSQ